MNTEQEGSADVEIQRMNIRGDYGLVNPRTIHVRAACGGPAGRLVMLRVSGPVTRKFFRDQIFLASAESADDPGSRLDAA
jgi:hypothetical protein